MKYTFEKGWEDEFRGKLLRCEFCGEYIDYDTNYGKIPEEINGKFAVLGNVFCYRTEYIVLCPSCFDKLQNEIKRIKREVKGEQ